MQLEAPLRPQRVAVSGAVALPAMVALAWPVAALGWPQVGTAVAVALLGAWGLSSLWRGAAEPGRGVLTVAALYAAGAALWQRPGEPESGLACLLGLGALLVDAHGWLAPRPMELAPRTVARWSTGPALALLFATTAVRVAHGVPYPSVAVAVGAVPLVAAVEADRRAGHLSGWVAALTWAAGLVALVAVTLTPATSPAWGTLLAGPVLAAAAVRKVDGRGLTETLFVSPARLLVVSFAAICAWGTALLVLGPSGAGRPLSLVDAAFTSVSATCVTGLVVRDTGGELTGFGQLVVLVLIQVGGIGIMTFAAAASVWAGRRMSLREEATAADLLGPEARRDLEGALGMALKVTLLTEAVTAAVLVLAFLRQGDGVLVALWRGVFTSVSAFCNAGFALQADSLVPYRDDPFVLVPVSLALIAGGLGPGVVAAIPHVARGRGSLHAQVVLTVTAALILLPWGLYALLEWNASLADLSVPSRLLNAWFQAVTPRTAGFNSVDLAQIRPPTWTLLCVLMFVGGSPGSTAGGVKTTTVAAIVLAALAAVRGREQASAFGRRLPAAVVMQALATTSVGLLAVIGGLVALQLTQAIPLDVVLFEVVSALGTVGLSIGGTGALDGVGKVVVMACMFAGRVGPLTVVMVLAERRVGPEPARPEGSLLVG
ncbi:MAG: potassium transporter TrkG [Myxococcota bacterium]